MNENNFLHKFVPPLNAWMEDSYVEEFFVIIAKK